MLACDQILVCDQTQTVQTGIKRSSVTTVGSSSHEDLETGPEEPRACEGGKMESTNVTNPSAFKLSRPKSGRARRYSKGQRGFKSHGTGRVTLARPNPTRLDPTPKKPCNFQDWKRSTRTPAVLQLGLLETSEILDGQNSTDAPRNTYVGTLLKHHNYPSAQGRRR